MVLTNVRIVQGEKQKTFFDLELSELLVPDPNHRYALNYDPSAFADDKINLAITKDGFLTTADITAEDRTGDVIRKLAELAKEVAKIAGAYRTEPNVVNIGFRILDVTDPREVRMLNDDLTNLGSGLRVAVTRVGGATETAGSTRNEMCLLSICFRPREAYLVSWTNPQGQSRADIVLSPNRAPIIATDISRAAFVAKTDKVTFDNGFFTGRQLSKPSEALAIVSVPVDVAKTIVSIPGEILKFRYDNTKNQTNLINAQKDLVTAQKSLIDAQNALKGQQSGGSGP
jgi:hypothetical protein